MFFLPKSWYVISSAKMTLFIKKKFFKNVFICSENTQKYGGTHFSYCGSPFRS